MIFIFKEAKLVKWNIGEQIHAVYFRKFNSKEGVRGNKTPCFKASQSVVSD